MITFASLKAIKHELHMLQLELELHIRRCPVIEGSCAQDVLHKRMAAIMQILDNAVVTKHRKVVRDGTVIDPKAE